MKSFFLSDQKAVMICFFASPIFPFKSMVCDSKVSTKGEITSSGSDSPSASLMKTASASNRSLPIFTGVLPMGFMNPTE